MIPPFFIMLFGPGFLLSFSAFFVLKGSLVHACHMQIHYLGFDPLENSLMRWSFFPFIVTMVSGLARF